MLLLESLIAEFRVSLTETESSVKRYFAFPEADNLIKVAIGMRRSGKTYFLYQHIHQLLSEGIPLDAILCINFEDDRLLPMDQKQLATLLEAFYSLYPDNHQRQCYLFLDEIQNVEGWQLVIRRFFDTKNIQFFLTGSSAKLLSKEIATNLRGRSIALEIWPYDFREYVSAHPLPALGNVFGNMAADILHKTLLDFFKTGGFPAVQQLGETAHRETLQNYVETTIFRDIVERHHVTNITLLKYLITSLLKNISAPFSLNKFYNDIKSQGYQAAKDTIYNYVNYLEDAYLIATVPLFTESLRIAQITSKKIYAVDNGLVQANVFSQSDNVGRLLENQVYLDLRRAGKKIFYYLTKSGYEIDFVTQSLDGKKELIQVVWDMSDPATRKREERALQEAQQELNIPGRIIDREAYLREWFGKLQ
jgi:predicted AAA+ superfamily ATPase